MENNKREKRGRKRKKLKEFFTIRQLDVSELTGLSFYVFMAILSGARGVALIQMTDADIARSAMYMSLHQYADITIWGVGLIALSAMLVLAVLLPNEPQYILTVISNSVLALLFILLSAAALQNGSSTLNLYNHTIISVAHIVLAGLGVVAVCRKTKNT